MEVTVSVKGDGEPGQILIAVIVSYKLFRGETILRVMDLNSVTSAKANRR